MTSIASCLQQVLDLAPEYSATATPAMEQRDAVTHDLAVELSSVLAEPATLSGLEDLDFRTQPGGFHGYYGPIPWVRIYSPQYSRSAMRGIYLVYIFAADGSRAYLSLMQGTSEWRSGAMRSISRDVVLSRSAQARSTLGDLISPKAPPVR